MIDIRNRVIGFRTVKASALIPNSKNPRTHPADQILALQEAFTEIGFAGVMLARENTAPGAPKTPNGAPAELILLDGHARAKIMGDREVPVVILDLTEDEEAAFLLTFDPISGLATYAKDLLRDMMANINLQGEKLRAMMEAIAKKNRALPNPGKAGQDPGADLDQAPTLQKKWKTRVGQLWEIEGRSFAGSLHYLAIGDSTMAAPWALLQTAPSFVHTKGLRAHNMWTDPPYGVNYEDKVRFLSAGRSSIQRKGNVIQADSPEGLCSLLQDVFKRAKEHMIPGARWYVAGADKTHSQFLQAFELAGMLYRQYLVWVKNELIIGRSDYHYRHEGISYGVMPGKYPASGGAWYGDRKQDTVFEINKPHKAPGHPTMKPPELISAMIENTTRVGDLVLDPFAGSGSTMVACEQLSRRCVCIEIDPGYAAVILDRIQGMGCTPRLITKNTQKRSRGKSTTPAVTAPKKRSVTKVPAKRLRTSQKIS